MKKKVFCFLAVGVALLFGISCQHYDDAFLSSMDGDPMTISINLRSKGNTIISRAVSSDEEEKRINNVYVFIFNSDNTISYRQFFDNINKVANHSLQLNNIRSGSGKQILLLVNINSSLVSTTSEALDMISSKEELEQLVCELNQNAIERGSNFMMSGSITTDLVPGKTGSITIPIKRLDAKIRFNIVSGTNTYGNVIFTPRSWRVVRAPKKIMPFSATETDIFNDSSSDFFQSGWNSFEGEGSNYGKTFAFYLLENRVTAKKMIPATGSAEEQYALREKQEKIPVEGTDKVNNGSYDYAPNTGTYIQMTGTVWYKLNSTQEISSEVTYTIHLGYSNNNPNDYMIERNTEYIYTVTINSVNNIIVEVESSTGEEPQPGAEGQVVVANVIKEFDAHYETFSVPFNMASIDASLTWNVTTPFSSVNEGTVAKDYKWIFFKINRKTGNFYNENLRTYPGRSSIYTEAVSLDSYMSEIRAGTDKLLDVTQLIPLLIESKARKQAGNTNNLFDSGDNIRVTVYLDEYYYENNPITGAAGGINLWKSFVNQPERIMNILSTLQTSQDQKSSKSVAVYSFRQSSIQTIYNPELSESLSAWGTQQKQDNTLYLFDRNRYTSATSGLNYNSWSNGRQNSIQMWNVSSRPNWSTYINGTSDNAISLTMQSDYNYAKYRCMRLNRDNNGDGRIDQDEVRWYLASVDQLRGIWVGEQSLNSDARLFTGTTWNEVWYSSSTVTGRGRPGSSGNYYDNPVVIWSSEGASDGPLGSAGGYTAASVRYRCVRNLGLASNASESIEPDDYASYNTATGIIEVNRLNSRSIRGYTQTNELPEHHERQADNKPYWSFQVEKQARGSGYSWVQVRNLISNGNSPCPSGWRVPNQREMVLMVAKIKNDGNWTQPYHMSRTRFQFNPAGGSRYGFAVQRTTSGNNANMLFLINNTSTEIGGVRCVRDR